MGHNINTDPGWGRRTMYILYLDNCFFVLFFVRLFVFYSKAIKDFFLF